MWPVDRGVQPGPHRPAPTTPTRRSRPGPRRRTGLDATQADADAAAKRFWQRSSWYRRASIRNESLAGQPVIDDLPTQGAVLTDERHRRRRGRRPDGPPAHRGRAVRATSPRRRSSSSTSRTRSSAATRATTELLGSPRDDDPTPFEALLRREIDRLEPQKLYLPLGRRQPRRPPALPRRRRRSCSARAASG